MVTLAICSRIVLSPNHVIHPKPVPVAAARVFQQPSTAKTNRGCRISISPTSKLQVLGRQVQSPAVLCFSRIASGGDYPPKERQSSPSSNSKEVAFDIKVPRRNLLVEFTCDSCGERTKRLINKVAYEKGTIFIQCAGCLAYHRFVDNLGLVVEYDLREEDKKSDTESEGEAGEESYVV